MGVSLADASWAPRGGTRHAVLQGAQDQASWLHVFVNVVSTKSSTTINNSVLNSFCQITKAVGGVPKAFITYGAIFPRAGPHYDHLERVLWVSHHLWQHGWWGPERGLSLSLHNGIPTLELPS